MKKRNYQKKFRRLQKGIKPYGYYIAQRGRHPAVYDAKGKWLCSLSGSPRDIYEAEYHTWRWLIKMGHLPEDAKL